MLLFRSVCRAGLITCSFRRRLRIMSSRSRWKSPWPSSWKQTSMLCSRKFRFTTSSNWLFEQKLRPSMTRKRKSIGRCVHSCLVSASRFFICYHSPQEKQQLCSVNFWHKLSYMVIKISLYCSGVCHVVNYQICYMVHA